MPGLPEEIHVVDVRELLASPNPRIVPGMVLDFTYLDREFVERVPEIEDPWTGEDDKAAAAALDLPELAVSEDGKVMELVEQGYIRALLKSPPRTKPVRDCSTEALRRKGIKDEALLEMIASSSRNSQRLMDLQMDVIQQYLHKGYAYIALPLTSKRYPPNPTDLPPLPRLEIA